MNWEAYFEKDRLRTEKRQQQIEDRRKLARTTAKQLSSLLADYNVQKVILTGSLLSDRFSMESDIDLAVAGLKPDRYFRVLADLNSPDHPFDVDLIDLDNCSSIVRNLAEKGEILYERSNE